MRVWGRLNRGPPWGPDPPGLSVPVLWGLFTALDKVSMSHTFEPTLFTHSGLHRRWSYGREGGGGGFPPSTSGPTTRPHSRIFRTKPGYEEDES